MDDISRKRLQTAVADGSGRMDEPISEFAKTMPVDALNAELAALGVPPAANITGGSQWIGYVVGNMVAHRRPVADCHAILKAISELTSDDPYDVCVVDKVADALDDLDDIHKDDAEKLYRWARFMRVGVHEIVFALEDHFTMLGMHPGTSSLHERSIAATSLFIETMHSAFVATQIDSH